MIGAANQASGSNSGNFVAGIGNRADGIGTGNFVAGFSNTAQGAFSGNGVIGANNQASGFACGNGVVGFDNQASGSASGNDVVGFNNQASGFASGNGVQGANNIASGFASGNGVTGTDNIAFGSGAGNGITASRTTSVGYNAKAVSDNSIAIGTNSSAGSNGGAGAVAVGNNSFAAGAGDAAFGQNAQVQADQGTAVGNNATVQSGAVHSSAIGADATVSQDHEMVFGTKNDTYTTPGITSGLSKSRQTDGPTEVVISDQSGHLATDGGSIFKSLDEAQSGIALAISMENPDLVAGEKFGIAVNGGFYESAQAVSVSAEGVVGYNVFSDGDRVAVSGAVGVGVENGRGDNVVGGRVGGQITWR